MEPTQNIIRESDYKTEERVSRVPHAVFCALITAAIVIAGLTIAAELLPPLKNWLKETFFHHWVGKGILAFVTFIASFLISLLFPPTEKRERIALYVSIWTVILAILAIAGLFLYELLKH